MAGGSVPQAPSLWILTRDLALPFEAKTEAPRFRVPTCRLSAPDENLGISCLICPSRFSTCFSYLACVHLFQSLATALMHVEYNRSIHSSGVLWFTWLFFFLCSLVPFYSHITRAKRDQVTQQIHGRGPRGIKPENRSFHPGESQLRAPSTPDATREAKQTRM